MSTTRTPVEVTTRYATTVDELADAWAFIMERLESVGPNPNVTIMPVWTIRDGDVEYEDPPRHFSVVVSSMIPEDPGQ